MKRFATLFLAILFLLCTIIPAAAYQGQVADAIPAAYGEATHLVLSEQYREGATNARFGNAGPINNEPYLYLKNDGKGDFTFTFTVKESGTYSWGFTLFVLGAGKVRATRVKLDNEPFTDIRYRNTDSELNQRQYVTGFVSNLAAGEHTLTLSLPEDFDDSTVKTLYFHDFFYQKTDIDVSQATHLVLSEQYREGATNARFGNAGPINNEPYLYLKNDGKGDFTFTFTVKESGTYSWGFTLFVLGAGKVRATRVKLDNEPFTDIRYRNTDSELNQRQYVTGFVSDLAAGEHTLTLSLPEDFDDSTVKTLYFHDFFYQKTAFDIMQYKYDTLIESMGELPSYLSEATSVEFANFCEEGKTNARKGEDSGISYVYLKQDGKGDFVVNFTIPEDGYYNFGLTIRVLSAGKLRSTDFQIDDGKIFYLGYQHEEADVGKEQYISGLTAYMTAGEHTFTMSLADDFNDDTVKSLFLHNLMFQKTTEDFKYHKFGEWVIVKQPSCEEEGKKQHTCTECQYVEEAPIAATGHTSKTVAGTAATCTESGLKSSRICSVCQAVLKEQEVIPAKGHSFGEWEITKAATAEADGERVRTCTECHTEEKENIHKTASDGKTPSGDDGKTDDDGNQPSDPAEDTGNTGRIVLIVVIAVVAAAAIVVVAILLVRKKKNTN